MKLTNKQLTGLCAGMVLTFGSHVAYAETSHLAQAISNAQAATKSSTGVDIAEHAQVALTHAQAAQKSADPNVANEHLDAGIKSLEGAIENGTQGQIDIARKDAKEAKAHLKAAL